MSETKFDDCLSPLMSSTSFIFRYNKKFIERIGKQAPFFAFSFLGFPFHDLQLSHQNFDQELYSFFDFLNSSGVLERTMVIIGGDHGDRVEFFGTDFVEGFLERSLPFLFIQLPQRILKNNPGFRKALVHNTGVLTSHYDVHHTMLHVLALTDPTFALKFSPSVTGRTSLLHAITKPRGCSELNIEPGLCACNVGLSLHSVKDGHFLHRLYVFAVTQLNYVLRNSSYARLCGNWTILPKPEVKAHNVTMQNKKVRGNGTTDNGSIWQYLLFFATTPYARFQVRINVHVRDFKFDSLEVAGEFERKGTYGTSSSCIVPKTLNDRKFKELCYCTTSTVIGR